MSETATKKTATKARVPKYAVTIETSLPEIAAGQKTERYWVGTMPDCPIQNVTAGGVAFPYFAGEHLNAAGDLLADKHLTKGAYVDLTEEMVTTVLEAVRLRVVRFTVGGDFGDKFEDGEVENAKPKTKGRAHMVMLDSPRNREGYTYRPQRGDVPLARMVYMHNAEQMTVGQRQVWPPHPMEKPKE